MYMITVTENAGDTGIGAEWMISSYRTKSWLKKTVIVIAHNLVGAKVTVHKW